MSLRFGTDGVRGDAETVLLDERVHRLGRAAATVLGRKFVVGRDTRRSGPRIERALVAGLEAAGASVRSLGVAPTPAVAWEAASSGAAGAMISASHNPWPDNGIKLFAPGGTKLPDEVEARLEAVYDGLEATAAPTGVAAGSNRESDRWSAGPEVLAGYGDAVVASLEGARLEGLRVVVDCANGAASDIAPAVLERLGATVRVLHAAPDGTNINAGCGSTHPDDVRAAVLATGCDVGLAFDGDADRVVAVDERGELVDGDQLIALCARDLRDRGRLAEDTVVVTVMSNLGFRRAMADAGIRVVETKVGDRYVLEALEAGGWSLGGEQSGHVIFRSRATTGDGLLTGVQVLDVLRRAGRPFSELATEAMTRVPQVLRNVAVTRPAPDIAERIATAIAAEETRLGERGRVLVRPSGTEPLVRVMVEALDPLEAEATAGRLVAAVASACAVVDPGPS